MKITTLLLLLVNIMVLVPPSTKILSTSEDFTLNSSNISYSTAQLTPHPPIVIDGNSEFAAQASTEGWSGNGTALNPYVIDRLNISNPTSTLIEIRNVDLHFRVANCLLTGGVKNGIFFYSVSNGQVINNIATNNDYAGISMYNSHNNTLANNTATNNGNDGIQLYNSSNSIFTNNTATNNNGPGIGVSKSYNNIFIGNTVTNNNGLGIRLSNSYNNILTNNTATINGNDGIQLWKSYNNILANNTATNNNRDGIYLYRSYNNILGNNTVTNNNKAGIELQGGSLNNTLANNTVANNTNTGIELSYSYNNTLANNTVTNNNNFGIKLVGSYNNTLRTNNLIKNEFMISSYSGTEVRQTEVVGNIVNGKPLIFWQDTVGGTVPVDAGQIILINTTGVEVTGQGISNAGIGLLVSFSQELNIHSNIFTNNDNEGLKLLFSHSNTLANNTVANNTNTGIELFYSYNNTLANNTVANNTNTGIELFYSYNNTLANNTVTNNKNFGIELVGSYNNALRANNLINNEFMISSYFGAGVRQTEVVGNIVNGKPLIFWQDTVGGTVPVDAGQIILINTTGVEVTGQDISKAGIGLLVSFSQELNIHDNALTNNNRDGIRLEHSYNNILANNTVTNNSGNGIELLYSYNNTLANNMVANNSNYGIELYYSYNNILANNTVINNNDNGIELSGSYNNTLTNNLVTNNNDNGITLSGSYNNILANNTVANNNDSGIILRGSYNILANNTITNNTGSGIILWGSFDCVNNVISNNMISNNRDYGIDLSSWIKNNTVSWNSFLGNNIGGTSQAHDSNLDFGFNNIFSYNYWDDWTGPDINGDGIVDVPYPIDGVKENQDASPLVSSYLAQHKHHFLLPPRLIFPNGREILESSISISWFPAYDSHFDTIKYSVYFSSDAGNTWTLLVGNILNTLTHTDIEISQLTWNAGILPSGSNYMVKVIATCSEGLTSTDISDEPFSIINSSGTSSTTLPTSKPSTGTNLFLVVITLLVITKYRKKNYRNNNKRF